jgi:hypothetical protein
MIFTRHVRFTFSRLSLAALLSLSACKISTDIGIGGALNEITLSGPSFVAVGDTVRLSTWGRVSGIIGILAYDRVLDASWTVSDPSIATLVPTLPPKNDTTTTASAIVRGLGPGSVEITVSARGISGKTTMRVVQPSTGN